MDGLDRRILTELQENFPLEPEPYAVMARRLEITAEQLFGRVVALLESGVIRRLGFSIDSRKIGYTSTLAAVSVPPEKIETAAEFIGSFPQVTHSYLRDDAFNIWFTIIDKDTSHIAAILKQIKDRLKLPDDAVMNLPAGKLFKLDTRFK